MDADCRLRQLGNAPVDAVVLNGVRMGLVYRPPLPNDVVHQLARPFTERELRQIGKLVSERDGEQVMVRPGRRVVEAGGKTYVDGT